MPYVLCSNALIFQSIQSHVCFCRHRPWDLLQSCASIPFSSLHRQHNQSYCKGPTPASAHSSIRTALHNSHEMRLTTPISSQSFRSKTYLHNPQQIRSTRKAHQRFPSRVDLHKPQTIQPTDKFGWTFPSDLNLRHFQVIRPTHNSSRTPRPNRRFMHLPKIPSMFPTSFV